MNIYDIPLISPCLAPFVWLLNSSFGPDPRPCLDDDDEKSPWPLALGVLRSSMERTLRPGQVALCAPRQRPRRRLMGNSEKPYMGPLGSAGVNMVNTWLTHMILLIFWVVCIKLCMCVCVCVCGCI